jgi:hypothetical protein
MLFSEKIANQLLIQSKKKKQREKEMGERRWGNGIPLHRKMTLFKAVLRGKCSITTSPKISKSLFPPIMFRKLCLICSIPILTFLVSTEWIISFLYVVLWRGDKEEKGKKETPSNFCIVPEVNLVISFAKCFLHVVSCSIAIYQLWLIDNQFLVRVWFYQIHTQHISNSQVKLIFYSLW